MTYRLVEDYSTDDAVADVAGRTFPVPALVEDSDGIRLLLLPAQAQSVGLGLWQRAYEAGTAALACPSDVVGGVWYQGTERFIATRTQSPSGYAITWGQAQPVLGDYREMETPAPAVPVSGFVNLHNHFEYSPLDGLTSVQEGTEVVAALGQPYLGMTDHGNCAGHPAFQEACDAAGVKPVFGMEAYFQDDRHRRTRSWVEVDGVETDPVTLSEADAKNAVKASDSAQARFGYTHLSLWAMDDAGLGNLWAASTEAYREGLFDGKPRLDWETLGRFSEGLLCGTGCLRGPVARALLGGDTEKARLLLARLVEVFGDRLYVEVHTNALPDQVRVNTALIPMADQMGIEMIAVADSHYASADQAGVHQAWIAMQTGGDLTQESSLFAGGQPYHMPSEAEVRTALSVYLGTVTDAAGIDAMVANTLVLAQRCTARVLGQTTTPTYSKPSPDHPDPVQRDVQRMADLSLANWGRKVVGKRHSQQVYAERWEKELDLLVAKGFCGYFLIVWDYVKWAKDHGILVGPGRGSGGGSLIAYLLDIIELDPVDNDLIFERFLTEGRVGLPDFDIDFPASRRGELKAYVETRWGRDNVATIGTTIRLQSKGALNDTVRVLRTLDYLIPEPEVTALKALIDEADRPMAGKHLPWEEFCVQFEDVVVPMRSRYPDVFAVVDQIVGRVKTYGKHPAGVVISTEQALTGLPMRLAEDKVADTSMMVTQFDMEALDRMGLVKFDLLTLRTLDTIQVAMDLIEERFDRPVRIYDWSQEYDDPQVWEQVAAGRTQGIFQIETVSGTRLTKRYAPTNMEELAAVITLVRPGPMKSGLTETYLRRRAGEEEVTYADPRLEAVLGATYGTMIYQEDIMSACMVLAGYDSNEADTVRKILGKKQVEKVLAEGRKFVTRAIENGTDPATADLLWEQMAEFAKYSFGKAHAYGYAVLGYWCAWMKYHFPVQFIAAALSTVDDDRLPDFIIEARRMGYNVLGPDVNASRVHFTPEQMTMRYGLSNVSGVGVATAAQVVAGQPYASMADFTDRVVAAKGSRVNMGHLRALVAVGAFDTLVANRRAVEVQLEREASGAAKRCVYVNPAVTNPVTGLACSYDWLVEPNPPMVTKGRGKSKVLVPKPPQKACNVKCRQYARPDPVGADDVPTYSDADIRNRERELLGVWLSSTPFDRLPPEVLDHPANLTCEELESAPENVSYLGAAVVEKVRERKDVNGDRYAFVTLNFRNGSLDAICFAKVYSKFRPDLTIDRLLIAEVFKNSRGFQLTDINLA